MNSSSSAIAAALDRILGSWKPSASATADDLTSARQSLADAFASGFEISSLEKPSVIGVTVVPPPTGHPSTIPTIRGITDIDPTSVSEYIGMKVEKSLGPFVDTLGVPHWIDIIPIPAKIPISVGTNEIGYLIVDNPTSSTLHAGSLWISCAALNVPLLTSGFAGLSFSAGTVTTSGTVTVANTGITIGAGGTLTLKITLTPPALATGTPALGRDARAMLLNLPTTITVVFSATGAAITAIDDSAATVYGSAFSLKRNADKPFVATLGAGYIVYPCTCSAAAFAFSNVLSTDVIPSGSAPVLNAGWGIAITTAPVAQLGAASSAGALILQLGKGASLLFGDIAKPALLGEALLGLSPGIVTIAASNGARNLLDRIELWKPAPPTTGVAPRPSTRESEIALTIRRGGLLFCNVSPAVEAAIAFGTASLNIDKPVSASGARLPIQFDSALAAFIHIAIGKFVIAELSAPPVPITLGPPPRWSIALQNALLTVDPASSAVLIGQYQGKALTGSLEIQFGNATLLPTLPDPYASGDVNPIPVSGRVSALDRWTLTPGATVNFSIVAPSNAAAPLAAPEVIEFTRSTLLDLSTNVDQWGVQILPRRVQAADNIALQGVTVAIAQDQVATYALPGISWEPVVDDKTSNWYQASAPGDGFAPNDGPATLLAANSVQLVPVEADVALTQLVQAAATTDTFAQFTLPFGITAELSTSGATGSQRPEFLFVKGTYANSVSAARQLSIIARGSQPGITPSTPAFPGSATTNTALPLPAPLPSPPPYPPGILSYGGALLADPRDARLSAVNFFEEQFSLQLPTSDKEIPVGRIDLSGYGTSMFSDWADLTLGDVGVTRARFDVLVGRTAYELVQIQSIILPFSIRMTQTVIFERFDDGLVVRHQTDWKAINDGAFEVFDKYPAELSTGALSKLTNVRNIVPTGGASVSITSVDVDKDLTGRVLEFVPVTFDADAVFQSNVIVTANGAAGAPAAATQILGYAQTTPGRGATNTETLQLMQALSSGVSGSVKCIVTVGTALSPAADQYTVNASSLNVRATSATQTVGGKNIPSAIAVAVVGTPRLPRDGAWGITRRASGAPSPTSVDATMPVPLVRTLSNGKSAPAWMILDANDALSSDAPATLYGLLQGTGTSKSLFENPVIQDAGHAISLVSDGGNPSTGGTNSLADVASLLGAADIFPALANVLAIPPAVADALNFVKDGFKKTFNWTISKNHDNVTPLDDQTLLDLGVVSLILKYQNPDTKNLAVVTFTIDATASPRWSLDIENLAVAANVAGFSDTPLLTITGGFGASETSKAGFRNISVDYGDALADIKKLLSGIQDVVKAIGGDVDLDVGFSDNKLTIHDGFALPTLPLGLGEIENVALDLGMAVEIPKSASFHVGFASKDDPFTWVVDPLSGNGAIVLGTNNGDIDVYIEAGIGVALELDVAVASGGATIILEFSLDVHPPDVTICIALTGNANLSVLEGLASASITLTAAIAVEIEPGPRADLSASCAVGIHISICWVIDIDFDGSWTFHESIPLHELPI